MTNFSKEQINRIPIADLSDSRLDVFMRLTELQLRNKLEPEKGIFIAESTKVIARALCAGYEPISFLVPEHKLEALEEISQRISRAVSEQTAVSLVNVLQKTPVFVAPKEQITQLTGYELTRGVLCAMRRKPLSLVEDLLKDAKRIAILEDITNHTNVGAIFRSAAALNIDAVLVTPGCCDPLYRRAIRVSMGTVFQVPWTRIGQTVKDWPVKGINCLHDLGFSVASLALADNYVSLGDKQLKSEEKLAILLGTEGDGLSKKTLELSDYVVKIPMAKGVDSLNVAAASAVAFWELGQH